LKIKKGNDHEQGQQTWLGEGGIYQRADGKWVASIDLGQGDDGKRQRHVTLDLRSA
jgi:hypothetical protein